MVDNIDKLKEKSISLPITQAAIRIAHQFANQQPTESKKQQIYYNTLAVCVVNDYMRMMQIPTDLNASNSWNPVLRLCGNVADLMLSELGHLECRPTSSQSNELTTLPHIPPEIPDDRIGLIVVEIDVMKQEANLLGFAKTVETGALASSHLQTMDKLFEYIEYLENLSVVPAKSTKRVVGLSQWLQNVFEVDWQCLEELLGTGRGNLAFNLRNGSQLSSKSVKRAKVIDLGLRLGSQSITMVVYLMGGTEEVGVLVQVRPFGRDTCLPSNLRLSLLSESKEVLEFFESRAQDNCIQTSKFWCRAGESFSIQVSLNGLSVTEHFLV